MKHKKLILTALSVGLLVLFINLITSVKPAKVDGVFGSNSFKNMKEKFLLKNYRNSEEGKRKLNRVSDGWEEASHNLKGKKLPTGRKLKRVKSNKKAKVAKKSN